MSGRVRQVYTKWGGGRHWEFDTERLGTDDYGVWLRLEAGVTVSRPGASFVTAVPSVTLVSEQLAYTPTFHATWLAGPGALHFAIYVDMTTPAVWESDSVVSMVDLDLDVVRRLDGSVEVLDEDEFADHQVRLDYPDDIIDLAGRTRDEVVAALGSDAEPFASVGWDWLRRS